MSRSGNTVIEFLLEFEIDLEIEGKEHGATVNDGTDEVNCLKGHDLLEKLNLKQKYL